MTTINRSMYPVQTSMNLIGKMQERFSQLQVQLATGQKATNLAELGNDRYFDLSLRSRISRVEGYQNSVDMVNTRLSMFDNVLGRLDKIEGDARTSITPSSYGSGNVNFGTVPSLAKSRLDEVLNLMNTDIDGRYLFAGSKSDKKPVESLSAVLDGVAGKAGFKQVAAERLQADLGTGNGRLTQTVATDTVTVAEDGAHPFGFKLSTLTASSAAVTLTQPTGSPQSLSVQFNSVPLEGDTVTLGFTLPDGTEEGVTLKAVTGTPGPGEFQIGADANATAANFNTALQSSLTSMAGTKLAVASNYAAAENFFNGQGQAVQRVQGPNFATASSLVTADPATTVIWYKGEDSADPRGTVVSRIDENATVRYGAQANESGPASLIRTLAVQAIQSFTNADATSTGRFDAVASRNISMLAESHNNESGSIEMITVELGNAQASAASVASRNTSYSEQLKGLLEDLESVPKEDVAMELLALQTRLQASYQATSLISSLSLVNYIK